MKVNRCGTDAAVEKNIARPRRHSHQSAFDFLRRQPAMLTPAHYTANLVYKTPGNQKKAKKVSAVSTKKRRAGDTANGIKRLLIANWAKLPMRHSYLQRLGIELRR